MNSVKIMKRLILIQNDAPGTGKSTLTRCLQRYLNRHGAAHQVVTLVSEEDPHSFQPTFIADDLCPADLVDFLDRSSISIIEIESGLGEFFANFYQANDFENVLSAMGCQLSVVLPVSSEPDTYESVVRAAECYSDTAEYTIAHLVTGSYDDDESAWDRSYAARVMDMFEALELHIPEIGFQLEMELRAHHVELAEALAEPEAGEVFGRDFSVWLTRVMTQVESARRYLFGDAFVPTAAPAPLKTKKTRRSRAGF